MKKSLKLICLALALILALILGAMALAEGTEPEAPATEAPQTEAPDSTENDALQDALDAYYDARESSQAEDLEAELKEYVESGKLTQAQADLILKYYKEQQALRDGVCPNCGYEFQSGFGRGGKGGRGGFGHGGMLGGFGMRGVRQGWFAGEDSGDVNPGMLENPYRENIA